MARTSTNLKLDTGIRRITFTDLEDHVFSSFRINPTDIGTGERAMEVSDYFQNLKLGNTATDVVATQKQIEEKISYVLGYDSTEEIFGEVPALTLLPDGSFFVEHVINKLTEVVEPAVTQRQKAMQKRADKYTAKYDKK